jgi:glutamine synthetase
LSYQAEYIWIDGTEADRKLRSKTKIVADGKKPPVWGFDGSSTNQATGAALGLRLRAGLRVSRSAARTQRRSGDVRSLEPRHDAARHEHPRRAAEVAKKFASFEPMFGIEQEYTFFQDGRPYGWPEDGFPAPQGPYYCGVGGAKMPGRDIVEAHTLACMRAGIGIEGTNAEVMMGQWEFQVGILARSRSATSSGRRAGCSSASPRSSAWTSASTPSPSRVTGTARGRTRTSPPSRCARRWL